MHSVSTPRQEVDEVMFQLFLMLMFICKCEFMFRISSEIEHKKMEEIKGALNNRRRH